MTWENHGMFGWHVDHVIPLSAFNLTSLEDPEVRRCWALDNLQPLWWQENKDKGDSRKQEDGIPTIPSSC